MGIPGEELRPGVEHRQIERGPGGELVEIHVAAPARGRARTDHQEVARRRHRHDAHEWRQRHLDVWREQRDIAGDIELDDLRRGRREEIAQHAGARPGIVDPVWHAQIELVDAHLQHVAALGALHIERPGQHMAAQSLGAPDLAIDVLGVLEHLVRRNAGGPEERRGIVFRREALVRDGVDLHRLAGLYRQRRRQIGGEIAPDHRVRGRPQRGVRHLRRRRRGETGEPQATCNATQDRHHRDLLIRAESGVILAYFPVALTLLVRSRLDRAIQYSRPWYWTGPGDDDEAARFR